MQKIDFTSSEKEDKKLLMSQFLSAENAILLFDENLLKEGVLPSIVNMSSKYYFQDDTNLEDIDTIDHCSGFFVLNHKKEKKYIKKLFKLANRISTINSQTTVNSNFKSYLKGKQKFLPVNQQDFPLSRMAFLIISVMYTEKAFNSEKIIKVYSEMQEILKANGYISLYNRFDTLKFQSKKRKWKKKRTINFIGGMDPRISFDYQDQLETFTQIMKTDRVSDLSSFDFINKVLYYPTHIFPSFKKVLSALTKDSDITIALCHAGEFEDLSITTSKNTKSGKGNLTKLINHLEERKKKQTLLLMNCNFKTIESKSKHVRLIYNDGKVYNLTADSFCYCFFYCLRIGYSIQGAFDTAKFCSELIYKGGNGWQIN